MAKGIIYVMTTVVPGLIKIGKTGTKNYEDRMYQLERNGYSNVVGLKRHYAIEVEDYDEKEILLDDIFSKSRLDNTELFALDEDLVVQLLSSFEGRQVYPVSENKEEVFEEATTNRDKELIPDGEYILERKVKIWSETCKGKMRVENGKFIVLKGSVMCPIRGKGWTSTKIIDTKREESSIINNVLQEDVEFNSPSLAAAFIIYAPTNGWDCWKTKTGESLNIYRRRR